MQRLARIEALNRKRLQRIDELLNRSVSPEPRPISSQPPSRAADDAPHETGSGGLKRDSDWFLRSLSLLNQRPKMKPDEIFHTFRSSSPGRHDERRRETTRRSMSPQRRVRSRSPLEPSRATPQKRATGGSKFFARDYSSERVVIERSKVEEPAPAPAPATATNSDILNDKIDKFLADCRRKPSAPATTDVRRKRSRSPSMTSARVEPNQRQRRSASRNLRAADRSPDRVLVTTTDTSGHSDRHVTYRRDPHTHTSERSSAYMNVLMSTQDVDDDARTYGDVTDRSKRHNSAPKRSHSLDPPSSVYKKVLLNPNDTSLQVECVWRENSPRGIDVTRDDSHDVMYEDVSDTGLNFDELNESSREKRSLSRRPFLERTSDVRRRSRSPRHREERRRNDSRSSGRRPPRHSKAEAGRDTTKDRNEGHSQSQHTSKSRVADQTHESGRKPLRSDDLRVQLMRERSTIDYEHRHDVTLASGASGELNISNDAPQREVFVDKPRHDVSGSRALDSWDEFSISDDGLDEVEPHSEPERQVRQKFDAYVFRDISISPDGLDDEELDDGSTVMPSSAEKVEQSSTSGSTLPFASRYREKQDATPTRKRKPEERKKQKKVEPRKAVTSQRLYTSFLLLKTAEINVENESSVCICGNHSNTGHQNIFHLLK